MYQTHSNRIIPVALLACALTAGCLPKPAATPATGTTSTSGSATPAATSGGTSSGGSGGTGGGAGGSLSAYETAFNAANGQLPTQTAITGNATYTGEVNVLTNANAGNADESVTGDLAMTIDFTPNVVRPITATVENLSGEVNGMQTDIAGSLSTENNLRGVNAISTTNVNIGGQPTTFTGMSAELTGTLNDPTGTLSGETRMTMQGDFKGNDGASVSGATAVVIEPNNAPSTITGGTFYANKN